MSTRTLTQAGIGHVVVIFVIVFVAVIGLAGFKVATMNNDVVSQNTTADTAAVPEKIETKADLVQASKALDDSSSGLDSSLNDGAFNADMNDML